MHGSLGSSSLHLGVGGSDGKFQLYHWQGGLGAGFSFELDSAPSEGKSWNMSKALWAEAEVNIPS